MSLWRNRDYVRWLAGDTSSVVADAVRVFVIPLVAFGITHSTVQAGVLGTVAAVVTLVVNVPGGVLIDRIDRRLAMRFYATGESLVWGAALVLLALHRLSFGMLVVLAVAGAIVAGLFGEASNAALRSLVSTQEYPGAMATNQGRNAAVRMAASPLGGLLYGIGAWMPFAATLAGYGLLAAFAQGIGADLHPGRRPRQSPVRDLVEGFRWTWNATTIRTIAFMVMLINFGMDGAIYTFQYSLLQRGTPATMIGYLDTAQAVMTLLGSFFASRLVARFPSGRIIVVTLVWLTAACVPAAISPHYGMLLASMGMLGVALPGVNSALLGYYFAITPKELQGRVDATLGILASGIASLSPAAAGFLVDRIPAGATVGLFGLSMLAGVVTAVASRGVRSIPTPDRWAETMQPAGTAQTTA